MPLPSIFRRQQGSDAPPPTAVEQVQAARARARQRLIGAVVLLGIGIVGFPLLFESQPRPLPVDVKIEIPRKDTVAPLAVPERRAAASGVVTTTAREEAPAPREAPADAVPDATSDAASAPLPSKSPATTPTPSVPAAGATESAATSGPGAAKSAAAASAVVAKATSAAAAPAVSASDPPDVRSEPATARFVVQVGAFADRAAAQKTRSRVEGLGLKTYTQVVETADGARTRVRVGPFASRDEADRAASKLKAAGLPAAVLTL